MDGGKVIQLVEASTQLDQITARFAGLTIREISKSEEGVLKSTPGPRKRQVDGSSKQGTAMTMTDLRTDEQKLWLANTAPEEQLCMAEDALRRRITAIQAEENNRKLNSAISSNKGSEIAQDPGKRWSLDAEDEPVLKGTRLEEVVLR